MRVLAALIASIVALSVAVPQTAEACLNPVRLAGNKAVREVRKLEDQLKAGKNREVVRAAWQIDLADPALRARATLVATVAAMRLGQERAPTMYWEMKEDREDDVTPLKRLRQLAAAGPENPLILARIAEGLVRTDDDEKDDRKDAAKDAAKRADNLAEATEIIEDLAARDLMPDAEAWLTLAVVRARANDAAGRDVALAKCKKVARLRRAICTVPNA